MHLKCLLMRGLAKLDLDSVQSTSVSLKLSQPSNLKVELNIVLSIDPNPD